MEIGFRTQNGHKSAVTVCALAHGVDYERFGYGVELTNSP